MEIVNAQITRTMLGIEDHGCMTCMLDLKLGATQQGFGGYGFDGPITDADGRFLRRQGTAYGCEFIRRVLEVVGVERWEDLKGKYVRVKRGENWGASIVAIGNITEDKWFDPKELATELNVA